MNRQNIHQWIRYEGLEHYLDAKKAGRGVLFATAHFGNWELSAFAHALMTEPMHVMIRPLDNPGIDRFVEDRRQLSGNHLIVKWDGARAVLRALKQNEAVGVLIDQNTSLRKVSLSTFFGTLACANTAFAKIAANTGAAVIPGFAVWSHQERQVHSETSILHLRYPAIPPKIPAACTLFSEAGHPRTSRPVALDSSPLENSPGRATRFVRKYLRYPALSCCLL